MLPGDRGPRRAQPDRLAWCRAARVLHRPLPQVDEDELGELAAIPFAPDHSVSPRSHGARARPSSTFAIDVLSCAGCGGRLRFLATIEDPPVVTKILAHLGLPTAGRVLTPARPPPQPDEFDFA